MKIYKTIHDLMIRDVKLTFRLNWALSLAIAIFWIYSISGYPNGSAISNSFLTLCILCCFAFLVFNFNSDYFQSEYKVSLRLLNLAVFVFISFCITWVNLNQPLWGDQIYHANFAARHAQLFIYYSEHNAPYLWNLIRDISVRDLVQLINLLMLGLICFIFLVIPKIHFRHQTMLVMLMLFLVEAIRHYVGKNSLMDGIEYPAMLNSFGIIDPHPLFRAFPLVISSAIFGGADIGFRLAGFICFLLFLCFLFFKIKDVADSTTSILATISIATIPIFWHVSYLVEQSIWAVLGSSLIFITLTTSKKLEKVQLIPLISIVIIATLLRAPAFLCIIPVVMLVAHKFFSGTLTDSSEKKSFATLLMLLTLVVVVSAVRGSPATETENAFGKWLFSLTNNISAIASVSIIGLFPLFFIGFFLKTHDKDRVVIFLAAISFITAALFIYYGPLIKQLWGVGRYQAEIFVPLIVGGVILYCREIAAAKRNNLTIKLPLFFLIIINLFSFVTLDSRTVKYFADAPPPLEGFKAEIEYPFKEVFSYIKLNKLESNTYYVGIYYGGFVSGLAGFTADQYIAFSRLNNLYRDGWNVNADFLDTDSNIEAVIVESDANSGVVDQLLLKGWKVKYFKSKSDLRHELILLIRNKL